MKNMLCTLLLLQFAGLAPANNSFCLFGKVQGVAQDTCPPLQLAPIVNIFCGPGNAEINLQVAGGNTNDYQFQWSDGSTDSLLTGLSAGNYFVTVQDGNCLFFDTVVVDIQTSLQPFWVKTYGGSEDETLMDALLLSNGGMLLCGSANSYDFEVMGHHGNYYTDGWVVKTDAKGKVIWSKSFGSTWPDAINKAKATPDGGYLLLGQTTLSGNTTSNGDVPSGTGPLWIIKTDSMGQIIWNKRYNGGSNSMVLLPDGGFIVAGGYLSNLWAMRADADGNPVWQKSFGNSTYLDQFKVNDLRQIPGGDFILAGSTNSSNWQYDPSHGGLDCLFMRLSPDGDVVWSKTLGGSSDDAIASLTLGSDGQVYATGYTSSTDWNLVPGNNFGDNGVLLKFDLDGALATVVNLGVPGYYGLDKLAETSTGWLVSRSSYTATQLLHLNSNLQTEWAQDLDLSMSHHLQLILPQPNGDVILGGNVSERGGWVPYVYGNQKADWWMGRFGDSPMTNLDLLPDVQYFCDTASITLNFDANAYPGFNLEWDNGETSPDRQVLVSSDSVFSLRLTSPSGCTALDYTTLAKSKFSFSVYDIGAATCGETDGQASILFKEPAGPTSFEWDSGASNGQALSAGTHTIVATDSYCTLQQEIEIALGETVWEDWTKLLPQSSPVGPLYYYDKITPTSEGGAITAGVFESQYTFQKIDSLGQLVWSKNSSDNDLPDLLEIAPGDSFFTVSNNRLYRFDTNGNPLWLTPFTGCSTNDGLSLQALPDGSSLLACNTGTAPNTDVRLIRFSADGTELWNQTFGGPYLDDLQSMTTGHQLGEFLVCGKSMTAPSGLNNAFDAWLFSINEAGQLLWSKTYGGTQYDHIQKVVASPDGLIRARAITLSNDGDPAFALGTGYSWNLLLNQQGDLLKSWRYNLPSSSGHSFTLWSSNLIAPSSDGGWLIYGVRYSDVAGLQQGLWTKINEAGKSEWLKYPSIEYPYDFKSAGIDKYLVAGPFNGCCGAVVKYRLSPLLPNPLPYPDTFYACTDAPISICTVSTGFDYLWSTGETTEAITANQSGDYWVTQTNGLGCSVTDTFYLDMQANPLPPLELGDTLRFCADSLLLAPHPGPVYLWSTGETAQAALFPNNAGWVSLRVSDGGHCFRQDDVFIQPLLETTSDAQNIACFGENSGAITINVTGATGNIAYQWSNGDSTQTALGLPPGYYQVTVTDANGCTATTSAQLTEPTFLQFYIDEKQDISCFGDSTGFIHALAFGGDQPYQWLWSNGNLTAENNNLPAGEYIVTLTDANGCAKTISTQLTEPPEIVVDTMLFQPAFGMNNGSILTNTVGGTPPYHFQWSNGQQSPNLHNLPAGSYSLTITDDMGCLIKLTFQLDALSATVANEGPLGFQFSPNPTSRFLHLRFPPSANRATGQIKVLDSLGRPVFTQATTSDLLDLNALPPGTYLLCLTLDGRRWNHPFIKIE